MTKNPTLKPRTYAALFLLGITLLVGINASAGTITTLYSFSPTVAGVNPDGSYPGALILGKDGSFYGTTLSGGANANGALYKITSDGVFTSLYSFGGATDGSGPNGLTEGARGSFYGTTGGNNNNGGTVFQIITDGTPTGTRLTTLYTFPSLTTILSPPQGDYPQGVLALDGAGNLYGTTEDGGDGVSRQYGEGTVFKMVTDGTLGGTTLTTLHDFGTLDQFSHYDGALPPVGLMLGSDGNLYGTTASTVFQVTPSGALTTLHVFTQGDHGYPQPSALLEGPPGIFYGMNVSDGDLGLGQLFEFTAGGDYAVIHAFADPPWIINNYAGTNLDGAYPASWVKGSDGSFYGITSTYGPNGYGTLFKLTTDGTAGGTVLTTLYSFSSPYTIPPLPEGAPTGVALGTDGTVYGTMGSGANNTGAIFRFDPAGTATLPATTVQIAGTITPGGAIQFIATQASTVTGLMVRIQYSTTPGIEGSWTNLPDGNEGRLQLGATGTYSFGTVGTTFYPAGTKVYFRAITSAPGFTDSISSPILAPALEQAQLTINVRETSTSDPSGKLHIVHIGDNLNFTFIWTNIGNATARDLIVMTHVPTYQDAATDLHVQFPSSSLTFNQFGHYTNIAGDAQVSWNVSDLPRGSSQAVTLTMKVGAAVRLDQAIAALNNYTVYSAMNVPPTGATGFSSGAPNESSTVLGPFNMTVTPSVTSVSPGGLITYKVKVQNMASYTATNVVIADPVPEFTSFVSAAFLTPAVAPKFTAIVANKPVAISNPLRLVGLYPQTSLPPAVQTFLVGNPEIVPPADHSDQVVFHVGNLAKGASATVRLTVQTQFIDPLAVTDQQIKNLDYLTYFSDPFGNIVELKNESGLIVTPDNGPVVHAPNLSLLKTVAPHNASPGDQIAVALTAKNNGPTPANDVFIQDALPVGGSGSPLSLLSWATGLSLTGSSSQQQLNGAVRLFDIAKGSASLTQSKANYFVTLDPGGTLTIHGLHLEPMAALEAAYILDVASNAPETNLFAGASFIGAGNGNLSTNGTGANQMIATTPYGTPLVTPMEITGKFDLFTPDHPFEAVPSPLVSTDPAATASTLFAIYKKNPNASLIEVKSNPPAPIPGVQRYFIHYQNIGGSVANDVHLLFPIPDNTEFYRASFVSNSVLVKPPSGLPITEPAELSVGNVIFNLGTLTNGIGGYVMVEVIILPTAVNAGSSRVIASKPTFYQGAQPMESPGKLDDSSGGTIVYNGNVPKVGIIQIMPQAVPQGAIFSILLAGFNYGNLDAPGCQVTMQAPAGAQIVGVLDAGANPLPFTPSSLTAQLNLTLGYADAITVQLRATGPAGTAITGKPIAISVPYAGTLTPNPPNIQIVGANQDTPNTTLTTVLGAQFVRIGELTVIPLGQFQTGVGNALVCGPSIFFGQVPATIASGNGSAMAAGPAKDLHLVNLPVVGNTDTRTALAKLAMFIGSHGGDIDIFNGPGNNLIGADGESLINNDTGLVGGTVKALLKAGFQSVIPSGAGALPALAKSGPVALGGGTAVGQYGAHLFTATGGVVSNDGGSLIGNAGGTLIGNAGGTLISQDGSSLISQDGSSLISQDGSSLISSPQSAAVAQTTGGSLVGQGLANGLLSGAKN